MLTIRSLLQTLPIFSNGLSMLKSTYFNTLYVMAVLQSINIFGVKFRDRHIGIIDATGKNECTLGPERHCYRFPEHRCVREILACAHKIWRKMYIPYLKKKSERNFHMGGFLERDVRCSSALYTSGI